MNFKNKINEEAAQAIAISAIAYMSEEEDYLQRFFAITGLDADQMRGAVGEPSFLVGVLDFFLADEKSLLAFTDAKNIDPEKVDLARQLLAGPENFEG